MLWTRINFLRRTQNCDSEILLLVYFCWQWIKLFWSYASFFGLGIEDYYDDILCSWLSRLAARPLSQLNLSWSVYSLNKGQMDSSLSQTHCTGATSVNKQKAFTALILKLPAPQQSGNFFTHAYLFCLL